MVFLVAVGMTLISLATSRVMLRESEHPVSQILTLLDELQDQAKEEGKNEKANFMKYVQWCKASEDTMKKAITAEKAEVNKLDTKISGLTNDIDVLEESIAYLDEQIEEQVQADKDAKRMRHEAAILHAKSQGNFMETIQATKDATKAMEVSQGSMLQLETKKKIQSAAMLVEFKMTPAQRETVGSFLNSASFLQAGNVENQPEEGYVFKTADVINTFKKMVDDFQQEMGEAMTKETSEKNAYQLQKKTRQEGMDAARSAREEKENLKGEKESAKATAEDAKREEETKLNADSALLESTQKDCTQMSNEWDERCKVRDGEIEAMQMAQKILSKVTGVRKPDDAIARKEGNVDCRHWKTKRKCLRQLNSLSESKVSLNKHLKNGVSLMQSAVFLKRHDVSGDNKTEAIRMLKASTKHAGAVHVKALNQLADQLMTFDGPFDKLNSMIQKMIFRLMDEQNDEDQHKDWCDLEVERSTATKEDKDDKIRGFSKKLEAMDKAVKKAIKKMKENNKRVEQLTEHMGKETELRDANHKDILITIKDSKDAQAALTNAISVLTAFYKESGMIAKEPWEFVQTGSQVRRSRGVELPESPKTWDSSYTGTTDPKNGENAVLTLLEETNDKFAAMEADATVQNALDQKNYEADMAASKIELEETRTDTTMKAQKKSSLEEKIEGMTAAKKHSARELSAVEAYLKDLEPACGEGDSSYEDRKQARKNEIEALRKAQNIFADAFREK